VLGAYGASTPTTPCSPTAARSCQPESVCPKNACRLATLQTKHDVSKIAHTETKK
jgi:hypothetical protein